MKHCVLILLFLIGNLALAGRSGLRVGQAGSLGQPFTDSMRVAASTRYQQPGLLRKLMIGKNYRSVWSKPVTMAIFRLGNTDMRIVELGGGQQTKSLRLTDRQGTGWVLRTVDKDVEKAMPEKLRGTLAQKVVQDLISAAHPYAPLVVARLAKAANVPAPDPQLFYVPDDPGFGQYQAIFAHQVCFLERRDPTPDGSDSKSSASVLERLTSDQRVRVWQQEVLRARLLDMLVADWDRHADQWRWGIKDSAGQRWYYAIPRDRDQAFFRAGGLVPRVGKAVAMQHLNWFKKELRGLHKLNYKSRSFDRIYLNELDAADWQTEIEAFTASLTDEVIEEAVRCMPAPIYQMSGATIAARLKSRRNDMKDAVLGYYGQLAQQVQVWGTKGPELFELDVDSGNLRVRVYALAAGGKKGTERYTRVFNRRHTKEIHLEGLGGSDRFVVHHTPARMPRVFLYGGGGADVYDFKQKRSKRIRIVKGSVQTEETDMALSTTKN